MKNDKAPGTSRVTTNMLKNFLPEGFELILSLITEYWTNPDTLSTFWQITKLNFIYKGKGDHQDLNNFRGICLKETTANIISIIIHGGV